MNPVTAGRARLLIAAAAAAAVLAGCGPGTSSASSSAPASPGTARSVPAATASAAVASAAPAAASGSSNVCSLLSAAQASAINKITYGPGVPKQVESGWGDCTYPNKGSADPVDIQPLDLQVISVAGCYDRLKSAVGSGVPVSGVGDAAYGFGIGLLVRTGSTCVQVEGLTHAELNGDHSGDVAIAKIVLAGLH